MASCADIRRMAVDKWKMFHSDCFDGRADYMLLLEDGQEALFLPGPQKEFFTLKRYKEEIGKDYQKIVLYLCAVSDYHEADDYANNEHGPSTSKRFRQSVLLEHFDDDDVAEVTPATNAGCQSSTFHRCCEENDCTTEEVEAQVVHDEALARQLQSQLDDALIPVIDIEEEADGNESINRSYTNLTNLVKSLERQVDNTGQFFLVIRRGAPFHRLLSLWQRECKKSSPNNIIRIKYVGENGIDSGAMAKEFLANAISDMGSVMFPDGAPVDSVYNIQNGYFRSCGELAATSIVQGGPAPCFLDENVYNMIITPDVDITKVNLENHFTTKDKELFNNVKQDLSVYQDFILDHGYTGIIDESHKDDIIATMMVSITGRRLLYLKEFSEGLKLYGVLKTTQVNSVIARPLFVRSEDKRKVDANYLVSLMSPHYSEDGTTKRAIEERIVDNLQDFLMSLEDESISGYSEAIAWVDDGPNKIDDGVSDGAEITDERFQEADLSPAGVLGWLTGQRHVPLNGETLQISVYFDHDCKTRNPSHTVCFPTVGACGRVLTLPVAHMTEEKKLREVFLLAYCKGNAFAKA